MSPRTRRILLALLCVLLIGGVVLCGPGHGALHHDQDSASCDACHLTGIEAPSSVVLTGPVLTLVVRATQCEEFVRTRDVSPIGRPRGPPASC